MKSLFRALLLTSAVVACTELPEPHAAALVNPPKGSGAPELGVTVHEVFSLSSPAVGVLSFRFANETTEFLHVDRVLLGFGGEKQDQSVAPLWGSDLESWSEGIVVRNEERQFRRDAAVLGLFVAADVLVGAASLSDSKHFRLPPPTATQLALDTMTREHQSVPAVVDSADGHLLAVPFAIPPKLDLSRWVALQTRDPGAECIHFVSVRMLVRERGWRQYATNFRGAKSPSEWQAGRCAVPAARKNGSGAAKG